MEQMMSKTCLSAGTKPCTFDDGAKVWFHFKTQLSNDEETVIDDSRTCKGQHLNSDKPLEIIIGKKFKFEPWEICLKTMAVGEVSKFRIDKSLCHEYPTVAKALRDIAENKKPEHQHMCGMRSMNEGHHHHSGHKDLDQLKAHPQDLNFTLELVRVEEPGHFEKDTWAMTDDEKRSSVPTLKTKGNQLYMEKEYQQASDTYGKAIGILEELMMKEKPNSPEWTSLRTEKDPLLLNYSQCRLLLEDYYPVIEHTTAVLESQPDNVKALFRRAKAHVGAWNPDEAVRDFERALELDPSLKNSIQKQLKLINDIKTERDVEDKEKLKGLFQ